MFKQCFNEKMYIYTDGSLVGKQISDLNYEYFPVRIGYPGSSAAVTTGLNSATRGRPFAWSQKNETDGYKWTSFSSTQTVNVRFVYFGANQDFVAYNPKFFEYLDQVAHGGEDSLVNIVENIIPNDPDYTTSLNPLLAIWAYKAPQVTDSPLNFGGYKLVFQRGIMLIDAFALDPYIPNSTRGYPTTNYGFIDNPRIYASSLLTNAPLNTSILRITTQEPSSVPSGIAGPTARDDEAILRYFAALSEQIGPDKTVQMQLTDAITQRNIANIRYDVVNNAFYIYGESDIYKALQRDVADINVTSIEIVPKSNPMAFTDTTTWLNRQITPLGTPAKAVYRSVGIPVTSNAALIAGAQVGSSIYSGLFGMANNLYSTENAKAMQEAGFKHENEIQGNYMKWQSNQTDKQSDLTKFLQGSQFTQEHVMNERLYNQNQNLQGKQFSHEQSMLNTAGQQQKDLAAGLYQHQRFINQSQNKLQRELQEGQLAYGAQYQSRQQDFQSGENFKERGHALKMQANDLAAQRDIAQQQVRNQAYLSGTITGLRNLPGSVFK